MYPTLQAQIDTESSCRAYKTGEPIPTLNVSKHIAFLSRGLEPLSAGYVTLDAARPWLFYWCLNGLALLPGTRERIQEMSPRLAQSLAACQHPHGGFGGGNGQLAHLAPTYAAVLSAAIVGTHECFEVVDRARLYSWIMSLKQEDGGFAIQRDGEVDARAAYLALSVAALMNILTPEMTRNTATWLSSCQRYEGGLSGVHNAEAHGGLAFCAVAALCILGSPTKLLKEALDLPLLTKWLVSRQMEVEGGYSGRTNKLVDGCYSWWVGGEFALIEAGLGAEIPLFDRDALSSYILSCCQVGKRGGLRDKPEKQPDYYHTCYCLAGLSAVQHKCSYDESLKRDEAIGWESFCWTMKQLQEVDPQNQVGQMHPIFVLPHRRAEILRAWSVSQPPIAS